MTTTHYLIIALCLTAIIAIWFFTSWRQEAKMHAFYKDRSMRWQRKFVRTFLRAYGDEQCDCDESRNQPVAGVTCEGRTIHDMN